MATTSINNQTRLSFAKVAASGGKENVALKPVKQSGGKSVQENQKQSRMMVDANAARVGRTRTGTVTNGGGTKVVDGQTIHLEPQMTSQDAIAEVVSGKASYKDDITQNLSSLTLNELNGTSADGKRGVDIASQHFLRGSSLEELQRIDSPPGSSTKPPSLDGKSTTSGTTFALDEKESLRPDDSASVKAAEDDDTFSGKGSIVAGSRIGSEAAARAYRSQGYDVLDKRTVPVVSGSCDIEGGISQNSSSEQQPPHDTSRKPVEGIDEVDGFGLFYKQGPDEKLLEALDTPANRVFLLRLEQQVIEFVKSSKESFMDLPPCNSFCRMLTHKLADYYHLTHTLEVAINSVRIFRTPFCRLPHSLTTYTTPTEHVVPPSVPAMKIMRRGDGNESVSKSTSEVGSDGKSKGRCAKEKQSREQREAEYKKARERIFGATGDEAQDTDNSNDISRSSSVSVKERMGQKKTKAKQRRDDSDGFESRATFTPFYGQPISAWTPTQQYTPMVGQPYNGPTQHIYPTPPNPYGHAAPNYGPPQNPWIVPQQMMLPPGPQNYSHMLPSYSNPGVSYPPRSVPRSSFEGASPPQVPQMMGSWAQNSVQGPYLQHGNMASHQTIPYAFGQLPGASESADFGRQHPIPGSFVGNRHAFNPQTQSFVPSSSDATTPQATPHVMSPPALCNNYPHSAQGNYHPFPNGNNMQYQNNGNVSYNVNGQAINSSYQTYHTSPPTHATQMMPPHMQHNIQSGMSHGMPNGYSQSQSHGSNGLPHFGSASNLPPKPPSAS